MKLVVKWFTKIIGAALLLMSFWMADLIPRIIPPNDWDIRVLAGFAIMAVVLVAFRLIGKYITTPFFYGGEEKERG